MCESYFLGTDFQKDIWHELEKIPFGQKISYVELAKRSGNEKAFRAVANANGKNNFTIIVPCHRVINNNGSLGGYSAGITKKRVYWSLKIETFLFVLYTISSTYRIFLY